ncbi:MAG: hypothetical protein Q9177_005245 [Variospora cf. flavescens]
MTARHTASETSPLLPKGKNVIPEPAETPHRAFSNTSCTNGHAQENFKSVNEEQGRSNGEDNDGKYQGLPQVKKQLRYIVPAVAIGIFLAAGDQTIIVSTYGVIGSDLQALNKTSWVATRSILAGIGGGGMTTVVSILLSDIVTLRERGVWQGIVNII